MIYFGAELWLFIPSRNVEKFSFPPPGRARYCNVGGGGGSHLEVVQFSGVLGWCWSGQVHDWVSPRGYGDGVLYV